MAALVRLGNDVPSQTAEGPDASPASRLPGHSREGGLRRGLVAPIVTCPVRLRETDRRRPGRAAGALRLTEAPLLDLASQFCESPEQTHSLMGFRG